ncbi:MAG: TIGR01212 family radical SAM protein [Clostridiales bacterium]|nr:TIGR01212 family radical SAM protein [Clostridiales bacterium]
MQYTDYSTYLARYFDGKVQKLAISFPMGCPNRDGTKGWGGCVYCNNKSFSPSYGHIGEGVRAQLEAGKHFFARKYPSMRYLAYFQSYTNTYGDVDQLIALYREALEVDGVVGLVIGTRPDMMPQILLDKLARLAADGVYIMIEYGAESSHDSTLERVNRCHTWADTIDAVERTSRAGLHIGLHLIMGLPGETRSMMLETIDRVSRLPVDVLKLHQLQVLKGTQLAAMAHRVKCFTLEGYLDLCREIVARVPRSIAIERFTSSAPADMLLKPAWGVKNYQFVNMLNHSLDISSPVTLYVSDLDGTLLDNSSKVSSVSAETISRLSREGALITIATARTPATVVPLLAGTYTTPKAIVMTGAAMWDRSLNQLVDMKLLSRDSACDIVGLFDRLGVDPFIYTVASPSHLDVYHGVDMNRGEDEFYQARRSLELKKFHIGRRPDDHEWDKVILIFAIGATGRIRMVDEQLAGREDCSVSFYPDINNPARSIIEVFAHGVSKAEALQRLAAETGAGRTVVFGDNLNDLSMFSVATVSVAVANAYDEVKEAADEVIGPNSADSVARYIEQSFCR